jgi:hypothetical protein
MNERLLGKVRQIIESQVFGSSASLYEDHLDKASRYTILLILEEVIAEITAMRGPTDVPRTDKSVIFDEACDRCIEIIKYMRDFE